MTDEFKKNLEELQGFINNWNRGKIATEEEFIDSIRPIVLKLNEEIAKPKGEQKTIT